MYLYGRTDDLVTGWVDRVLDEWQNSSKRVPT
jgi:hypothetical protein